MAELLRGLRDLGGEHLEDPDESLDEISVPPARSKQQIPQNLTDEEIAAALEAAENNPRRLRARQQVSYREQGRGSIDDDDEKRTHRKRGPVRTQGEGRQKRSKEVSEVELEGEVAFAVGLNPYGFDEEEEGLLTEDIDEEMYCEVRNHILTRWRADVSRFLHEEEASAKVQPKYRHLVSLAWKFLYTHGYINFGVAPAITQHPTPEQQVSVVVVGAGLAGLSAARQLRNHGYKVVVVEAAKRAGGRVYGHRMEDGSGSPAVADLGGSIITGIDGNPLAVLAVQLQLAMHDINSQDVPLFLEDGSQPDRKLDEQVHGMFNTLLDRTLEMRDGLGEAGTNISMSVALESILRLEQRKKARSQAATTANGTAAAAAQGAAGGGAAAVAVAGGGIAAPAAAAAVSSAAGGGSSQSQLIAAAGMEARLIQWHMANIEFANAARLGNLSMKWWDLDDPYEHQGAHVFLAGSNLRLIEALHEGLPVFYNSPAGLLQYSKQGVAVHTDAGVFHADAALVTVPLGLLKRNGLVFWPPLPARKQGAIKRLGFGVLNKVMLRFPHCFWGDHDMFGHVSASPHQRGLFYLFYTYDCISGGSVLAGLVAGQAAEEFEGVEEGQALGQVMQLLRGIFGPQEVKVPEPLQAVCTRWGADPFTYGSYSSVAVGSEGPLDYDIMAEPLANKVFFAGEATTKKYPATMHGAFDSGLREAARIMDLLGDVRQTAWQQRQQQQQQGEEPKGHAGGIGKSSKMDAVAEEAGRRLVRLAEQLGALFPPAPSSHQAALAAIAAGADRVGPDLEVGLLRAYYGPPGSGLEDEALVAINTAAVRGAAKDAPTVFVVLTRQQLALVRDVGGGNDGRLALLTGEMGVKLMGTPLTPKAQELLEAIYSQRQQQLQPPQQQRQQQQVQPGPQQGQQQIQPPVQPLQLQQHQPV